MDNASPNPLLVWPLRLLALASCGLAGYLWYASASSGGAVGCDWAAFDCDAALGSVWAKWFGVPVASLGLGCYAAALVGGFLVGAKSSAASGLGWRLLEFCAPAAAGAAVWFVAVQGVSLGSFCLYCVLAHACALGVALLAIALRAAAPRSTGAPPMTFSGAATPTVAPVGPPSLGLPTVAGMLAVVALVGGQLVMPAPAPKVVEASELPADLGVALSSTPTPPANAEPPRVPSAAPGDALPADGDDAAREDKPPTGAALDIPSPRRRPGATRKVSFLQGRVEFDIYTHPLLGSPEAPHVVLEFMDYACPHCREFHEKLATALRRFEGKVAVVVLPVPSEILCNPYVPKARPQTRGACKMAKLSVATAKVAPQSFGKVHRWLLEGDRLPEFGIALSEARRFADPDELSLALASDEVASRIQEYVALFAAMRSAGVTGLPTQVLKDRVVSGPPKSVDTLCELWETEFELTPAKVDLPF
ncbi:MAG: thioredoxin domain-containing protein [Lacipirellulaceae bacterium]